MIDPRVFHCGICMDAQFKSTGHSNIAAVIINKRVEATVALPVITHMVCPECASLFRQLIENKDGMLFDALCAVDDFLSRESDHPENWQGIDLSRRTPGKLAKAMGIDIEQFKAGSETCSTAGTSCPNCLKPISDSDDRVGVVIAIDDIEDGKFTGYQVFDKTLCSECATAFICMIEDRLGTLGEVIWFMNAMLNPQTNQEDDPDGEDL